MALSPGDAYRGLLDALANHAVWRDGSVWRDTAGAVSSASSVAALQWPRG
jgi:hypothetical protein